MSDRHRDRRALVTGGANGIGRAVVLRLVAEGARVLAVDVEEDALAALASGVENRRSLLTRTADVTDEGALEGAVADSHSAWGGLDVVIANAAIEPGHDDGWLHEIDTATLRRVVDINLVGMALTCKVGLNALLSTGGGSIVCMASPTSAYGLAPQEAAYSIAKSGAIGIVKVIAAGYGRRGIRANAVMPGFTDTRVNRAIIDDPDALAAELRGVPLGRVATPDEVAAVVSFLSSDEASYVTGAVWAADGGLTSV